MAHRYDLFPGPVDTNGRPVGKCVCGRWEDATSEPGVCPNAQPYGKKLHPFKFIVFTLRLLSLSCGLFLY